MVGGNEYLKYIAIAWALSWTPAMSNAQQLGATRLEVQNDTGYLLAQNQTENWITKLKEEIDNKEGPIIDNFFYLLWDNNVGNLTEGQKQYIRELFSVVLWSSLEQEEESIGALKRTVLLLFKTQKIEGVTDTIDLAIAEVKRNITNYREYINSETKEVILAVRDIKEEGIILDRSINNLKTSIKQLKLDLINARKKLEIIKKQLGNDKVKLSENKEYNTVLEETNSILRLMRPLQN